MSEKKKTIFFDAVGTLFEVDRGVGFQYSRIALRFGVWKEPALLDQRFYEAFKKRPPLDFPNVPPSQLPKMEKKWWRDLVEAVFQGSAFSDFDSFFETLYSLFSGNVGEGSPWILFPETTEVLTQLSQRGHPLGMISNFDSRLQQVVASLGIAHFFQTITCSALEGVAKPNQEIFNRALTKAACRPADAVYIGNEPDSDRAGALSAGIPFILIDRKWSENKDGEQNRNVIADLREIDRYL